MYRRTLFCCFFLVISTVFSQGESCQSPIDLNPDVPVNGSGRIKVTVDNSSSSQFYKYTATQAGIIEMSSAFSSGPVGDGTFDTWLRVYDEDCNMIFDKDNTPGLLGGVEFQREVAIGDTYIFEWSNHEWGGAFDVEFIYHELLTDGLSCDDPRDIVLGNANLADNWWGAVYYTYTAIENGTFEISTCNNPYAYHRVITMLNACNGAAIGEFDDSCDVEDDGYGLVKYNMNKGEKVIVKMEGFIHMHHDYNFTATFVEKEKVTIPDVEFEKRLINIGVDSSGILDGYIYKEDAEAVVGHLDLTTMIDNPIQNLTGIEAFINITGLEAYNSDDIITIMDLSFCTKLEYIDIDSATNINNLDFTANTKLNELYVSNFNTINLVDLGLLEHVEINNASFTSLDFSTNTALDYLYIDNSTNFANIDLSGCTNLTSLEIGGDNVLSNINLSTNAALESLVLSNLQLLTSLDLTNNTALRQVSITDNDNLSSITFDDLTNLEEIFVTDNPLLTSSFNFSLAPSIIFFDLRNNNLSRVDIKNGTNENINIFNVTGNANLNCVQVDDVNYSNTNWTNKDVTTVYSETYCNPIVFQVKAYLEGAIAFDNQGVIMKDDLRTQGHLPLMSPYTNNEGVVDNRIFNNGGIFGTGSPDSNVVDWVFIELLDKNDNTTVLKSQSALLQRNGNVVSMEGHSNISFELPNDEYYISISHRNHIAIRTNETVSLSNLLSTFDFTTNPVLVAGGVNAMKDIGDGTFTMLAGDYDSNGQIQTEDVNQVILNLGKSGYENSDIDMNGEVQNIDMIDFIIINIGKGKQF